MAILLAPGDAHEQVVVQYVWQNSLDTHLLTSIATLHSRHHRLYVPYAYGALYNHPVEGFMLDTLGTGLAFKLVGMTTRQGMCLFTGLTIKTVDDHCGYAFPWDPMQLISSNNAAYHDVHHQSWGIKTNFSQPCFIFWDRLLGTMWAGGDVSARYQRDKIAAQKKVDAAGHEKGVTGSMAAESRRQSDAPYEKDSADASELKQLPKSMIEPKVPAGKAAKQAAGSREQVLEDPVGGPRILLEEMEEEQEAKRASKTNKSSRMKSGSEGLKGLRDRVTPTSPHGRSSAIIGMESSR